MVTTARYETPSCPPSLMVRSNTFSNVSPPNRPPMTSEDCPRHKEYRGNVSPKGALSGGENLTRSCAVPLSLKNLKADLTASSSAKLPSTASSDVNENSSSIHTYRKIISPGAMYENTRKSTIKHPGSESSSQKQAYIEQEQEHEQEDFRCTHNTPLHQPYKREQWDFPSTSWRNYDDLNQKEQHLQEHERKVERDSSHASDPNMPPPLWPKDFAKEVSNSVKKTVHDIISQGRLQHIPQRKFWSSLTPQDILRSRSGGNKQEEEEDDVLGSGSFSKVSKIYIKGQKGSHGSESSFALKRLKRDLLPSKLTDQSCKNGSVKAFTKAATELAREAFLLSRLDHPHIINIVGWTHSDVTSYYTYRRHDAYFLVLELLREETLEDRIEMWNQNDANLQRISHTQDEHKIHFHRRKIEQLTICKQIASALAYIHSKSIVYRDLKPQNIGFARAVQDSENDVVVKLMDFGLARELPIEGILPPCSTLPSEESAIRSHGYKSNSASLLFDMTGTVGTIRYMAPEVCLNRPYGIECDVYSWSIVSHEILSQVKPYDDMTPDMYQSIVCQQGVRPPTQNMSSEHTILLTQAWRTDPSKRLSLRRILRQLDLFLQQEELVWEAQELLSGMPEKRKSPIFLSQSYSDESTSTRHGSKQELRHTKRRCWYRNKNSFPNGIPLKNPIFPNASMDYHDENPTTSEYDSNWNLNHPRNIVAHKQSPEPQRYFSATSTSLTSRLLDPETPDRHYRQQIQQQEGTMYINFNKNSNGYHCSNHNGAGTRDGHLSPSHDYYSQWNHGYY